MVRGRAYSISLEHSELDDDYAVFNFEGKDAAVSPLHRKNYKTWPS